jgi:hypothetical protein
MPASFERLVQPIDLARTLLDLRLAIARQVAQLPDRPGRHEACLEQPGLDQPAQPLGIRDVGLATGDLLDVARVDQHALEVVFEDRPRRLPVDAGGFHRDPLDPVRGQPVAQTEQPTHRGRELRHVLLAAPARVGHAHTRRHLRLVDVQRRRALDDRLHAAPSRSANRSHCRPGASRTNESDSRARSTIRSSGETPHAKLKTGSQAPRQELGVAGDHRIITHFHAPARVRQADRTLKAAARPAGSGPFKP